MTALLEKALLAYARRFPLRKGKVRVVNGLWRAATGNGGSHRIAQLNYGDLKMCCDLGQALQRQFYFFGTYVIEEKLLDWWTRAARSADVIFDVGANVGIYSLAALAARPVATVHAFEPTPELAEKLRAAARLNRLDRLIVHEAAVYSSSGQAILCRFGDETNENEGMNYIRADRGEANAERVRAITLDDFCEQQGIARIDLIKVDVQGQEHAVLRGAERLLRSGRLGTLIMELNWQGGTECPAHESVRLLAQARYHFADPNAHGELREAGSWLQNLSDVVAQRTD